MPTNSRSSSPQGDPVVDRPMLVEIRQHAGRGRGNGKLFPDGSKMAKFIETQKRELRRPPSDGCAGHPARFSDTRRMGDTHRKNGFPRSRAAMPQTLG